MQNSENSTQTHQVPESPQMGYPSNPTTFPPQMMPPRRGYPRYRRPMYRRRGLPRMRSVNSFQKLYSVERARLTKRGCICECICGACPKNNPLLDKDTKLSPLALRGNIKVHKEQQDILLGTIKLKLDDKVAPDVAEMLVDMTLWGPSISALEALESFEEKNQNFDIAHKMPQNNAPFRPIRRPSRVRLRHKIDEQEFSCICPCYCEGIPRKRPPKSPRITKIEPYKDFVLISFEPPTDTGSCEIQGYQIKCIETGIFKTCTKSPVRFPNLSKGIWYSFSIRARNQIGAGLASLPSDPVAPTDSRHIAALIEISEIFSESPEKEELVNLDKVNKRINVGQKEKLNHKELSFIKSFFNKYHLADFSKLRTKNQFAQQEYFHKKSIKKSFLEFSLTPIPRSLLIVDTKSVISKDQYEKVKHNAINTYNNLAALLKCAQTTNFNLNLDPDSFGIVSGVRSIFKMCLTEPLCIDELYAQILKLGNETPEEYVVCVYKLLYLALLIVRPSKEMALTILSFICKQIMDLNELSIVGSVNHKEQTSMFMVERKQELVHKCYLAWKLFNATPNYTNEASLDLTKEEVFDNNLQSPLEIIPTYENIFEIFSESREYKFTLYLPDNTLVSIKLPRFFKVKHLILEILKIIKIKCKVGCGAEDFQLLTISYDENLNVKNSRIPEKEDNAADFFNVWKSTKERFPILNYKVFLIFNSQNLTFINSLPENLSMSLLRFVYYQQVLFLLHFDFVAASLQDFQSAYLAALYILQKHNFIIQLTEVTPEALQVFLKTSTQSEEDSTKYQNQVKDEMSSIINLIENNKEQQKELQKHCFIQKLFLSQIDAFSIFSFLNLNFVTYKFITNQSNKQISDIVLENTENAEKGVELENSKEGYFGYNSKTLVLLNLQGKLKEKINVNEINKMEVLKENKTISLKYNEEKEIVLKMGEYKKIGKYLGEFVNGKKGKTI